MKSPPFHKVLPDDVGRVGPLGALILAWIRYVTAMTGPGEDGDRTIVDGETWWRSSHDAIGEALGGVPRKVVGRALLKLEDAGELRALPAEKFYGDRAQRYRVPDHPLAENDQGSDHPLDESGQSIGQKQPSSWDESGQAAGTKLANLPIPEELKEPSGGEKARAARGTRLNPHWIPPQDVIDAMRAECPGVELEAEHRKFVDYWTDKTGSAATKRSWDGTWRNWIRRAAENGRPRTNASTTDQRVAQAQALKLRPPSRLELL